MFRFVKRRSALGYFLAVLGIRRIFLLYSSPPSIQNEAEVSIARSTLKGGCMQEEIGTTAGAIWQALHTHGELSLTQLKNLTKAKPPLFDWAIGWLARENKISLTQQKRSIRVRLV